MKTELIAEIIAPNRDYIPKANPHNYENFLNSVVYEDFLREMHLRIEDMRDFYETCDSKKYLETRGGLAAMRLVVGIFQDLYENSKQAQEKEIDNAER